MYSRLANSCWGDFITCCVKHLSRC